MEKKLTKKQIFGKVLNIVNGASVSDDIKAEVVAGIQHEIELLDNKSKRVDQAKVELNAKLTDFIVDELAKVGEPVTITELMNKSQAIQDFELEDGKHLSNQKISSILNSAVGTRVVRVEDKRKAYFSILN